MRKRILWGILVLSTGVWVGGEFCDLERQRDRQQTINARLRVQNEILLDQINGAAIIRPLPITCGP